MKIYTVGGAVRDRLLGREVKDRDYVVVGATAGQLEDLGYRTVGRDFPVFLHPDTHEEYALARTERKSGQGYTGFEFHAAPEITLEQDLARRDITINAMAEDDNGHVIDPFDGRGDLQQRLLRHVSPAFVEDPLRILRVARFAARLDFAVAAETQTLMHTLAASGELETLPAERVWQELQRALSEPWPRRFFEVLRDCEALAILLPEIDRLFGVPQPQQHHPEIDTGVHTLMVLDQAVRLSDEPIVRFAALVHDLGKGTTPADQWPRHIAHEQRGVKIIEKLCARLKAPNDFRDLAVMAAREHGRVHRAGEMRADTILNLFEACDAFRRPQRFEQLLIVCEADSRGRTGLEDRDYPQADRLRQALQAANSVDAGTLATENLSGKEIGERIRQARSTAIATAVK
ncbi:tRNA nucleotidyltransferase (CCA-adding enzyme) [Methylohalomonas lacus]|uniref:Multifunctional CCA protein n=1 Tax=Methylohalomonas lacus TaxID=398773 RepID=A0AAE3HJ64_9GAMM|nr:multifunctional CCA addition/repair protein [Methylohalomonas lacus]MCS3903349.1 tRNA nucleotidyltransferase (CCA-adding enzyme) [Methylohalomonas lacus]